MIAILIQFFVDSLPFRNVVLDADKVGDAAIGLTERDDQRQLDEFLPVTRAIDELATPRHACRNVGPHVHIGLSRRFAGLEQTRRLPDQFFAGIPGPLHERLVNVFDPRLGIGDDNTLRTLLDRQRQFVQPSLIGTKFGHVARDAEHADDLALPVSHRPFGCHEMTGLATDRDDLFVSHYLIRSHDRQIIRTDHSHLSRRKQRGIVTPQNFTNRPTGKSGHAGIDEFVAPIGILDEYDIGRIRRDRFQELYRTGLFALRPPLRLQRVFHLAMRPADQREQQQRSHGDEQPALDHAHPRDLMRIAEKQEGQIIGAEDPEARKSGIEQHDAQGTGRMAVRITAHDFHPTQPRTPHRSTGGQCSPGQATAENRCVRTNLPLQSQRDLA